MKNFTDKFLIPLLIALIMFVIASGVNLYRESNSNKKRYIDTWDDIQYSEFDSTELNNHKVQVLYNGYPIYGAATVNVELYNYTDRDFENLKVSIEVCPEKGDSLILTEAEVLGSHNNRNGITKTKDSCEGGVNSSLFLEYRIEIANRADTITDRIFDANYGIISNRKPTLLVKVNGKSVEKQPYNAEHFQKHSWLESDAAFIIFFFIGYALLIYILIKITAYYRKKREKRQNEFIIKNLSQLIDEGKLIHEAKYIINTFDKLYDKFNYEDTSPFMRRLKKMKPPNDESHQIEKSA